MAELMQGVTLAAVEDPSVPLPEPDAVFIGKVAKKVLYYLVWAGVYFGGTSYYMRGEIVLQSLVALFLHPLTYFSWNTQCTVAAWRGSVAHPIIRCNNT